VGPRGSGGNGPKGSRGFLVLAARCPSATARQRRSSSRCGSGLLPAPLWTAGSSLLRDARIARSPSCPGCDEVEGAVAVIAARASKVFLLRLPFGRPRFRDAGGDVSGALFPYSPSVGTLSTPVAEPLREDMAKWGSERRSSRRGEK
jgi:hypothetical protein